MSTIIEHTWLQRPAVPEDFNPAFEQKWVTAARKKFRIDPNEDCLDALHAAIDSIKKGIANSGNDPHFISEVSGHVDAIEQTIESFHAMTRDTYGSAKYYAQMDAVDNAHKGRE